MLIAIYLISGLACLYYGAEWLVRGSASLALRLKISPLVIGLTVVAFGTSMPEMFVSVESGFNGMGDVSVGNVVGSNIFNIALILGLSALISPLTVQLRLLRFDVPFMILCSIVFGLIVYFGGHVNRIEGILMFSGIIIYTWTLIRMSRKEHLDVSNMLPESTPQKKGFLLDIIFIMSGLATLVVGSMLFLKGAVAAGRLIGISEAVIGLTIVAAGTSLPELATSVVAAFKKHSDISIGNIVGSNIFNILAIMGLTGIICPIDCPQISATDIIYMVGTAIILLPFMKTGRIISRKEGVFLLLVYISYLWLLWPK